MVGERTGDSEEKQGVMMYRWVCGCYEIWFV